MKRANEKDGHAPFYCDCFSVDVVDEGIFKKGQKGGQSEILFQKGIATKLPEVHTFCNHEMNCLLKSR